MQQILAVLAPDLPDITPAQRARAQRATLEQMMLLARGYAVDSQAVRCAAAMVGSAVAPDPTEYELAPPPEQQPSPVKPETSRQDSNATDAGWQRSEQYARYLRTILGSQPT